MGVYRRGGVWWINYIDAGGQRRFESVGHDHAVARKVYRQRLAEIEAGRLGVRSPKAPTFRAFVEGKWREEVLEGCKPSTKRGYETALVHHLLPYFGNWSLQTITRPVVKTFIAQKRKQQRWSYSTKNPNPNRPTLARKTVLNMVSLLMSILDSAVDYEYLQGNPLRGILKRRHFPQDAQRPKDRRPQVLEPEDFRRSVEFLTPRPLRMVLVAALAGLRWGEQVALRVEEEIDFRHNKIRITRSFYKRVPQTPKTEQSVRDVDMGPVVRRVMQAVPWKEGLVFSPDGINRIGDGTWLKRQWHAAQVKAGVRRPIRWHDLRHQFVSLLIAAGKHPLYIAEQAGHSDPGFTLKRYGHMLKTIKPTPVEWPEDLLWPGGCHRIVTRVLADTQEKAGEQMLEHHAETPVETGLQE